MAKSFAARLNKMKGVFDSAREDAGREFEQIPDGRYQFNVSGAELTESSNGNLMAVLECTVVTGEHEGEVYYDRQVLMEDNEVGMSILLGKIARLGYEVPDSPAEIESTLGEIDEEGPSFLGEIRTRGEYTNLHIKKVLEDGEEADDGEEVDDDAASGDEDYSQLMGARVSAEIDGAEYEGEVTDVNVDAETVQVEFDDGDVVDIAADEITILGAAEDSGEEEEEEDFVGGRVSVQIDDAAYEGEVIADDGESVTVKFDDGDENEYAIDDEAVTFLDGDDNEGEEEEEEEPEDGAEMAQLEVGSFVEAEGHGEGTVKSIAGNGNLTIVLHPSGKSVRGIDPGTVFIVPDDEIPDDVGEGGGDEFPVELGDAVEAVWDGDGETYSAEVVAIYPEGTKSKPDPFFSVKSEDGDRWDIDAGAEDLYTVVND